ncbi:hypothetical protein TKK_0010742 [Trichogramma kaykai]
MRLTLDKLPFLFIFIIVRDVKSEINTGQFLEAGLGVLTSLSNPLEFTKSLFEFANFIGSSVEEDDMKSALNNIYNKNNRNTHRNKRSDIKVLNKIDVNKIDDFYDHLVHILNGDPPQDFIDQFVNGVTNYYSGGITQRLHEMHSILYKNDDIAYKYSKKYELIPSPVCPVRYTQVKIVQKLYLALHNAELKGLTVLANALKLKKPSHEDFKKGVKFVSDAFRNRSSRAFLAQKKTMGRISNVLWNCQLDNSREGLEKGGIDLNMCKSNKASMITRILLNCHIFLGFDIESPSSFAKFKPFIYRSFEVQKLWVLLVLLVTF